jgi:hypothetical protein
MERNYTHNYLFVVCLHVQIIKCVIWRNDNTILTIDSVTYGIKLHSAPEYIVYISSPQFKTAITQKNYYWDIDASVQNSNNSKIFRIELSTWYYLQNYDDFDSITQ